MKLLFTRARQKPEVAAHEGQPSLNGRMWFRKDPVTGSEPCPELRRCVSNPVCLKTLRMCDGSFVVPEHLLDPLMWCIQCSAAPGFVGSSPKRKATWCTFSGAGGAGHTKSRCSSVDSREMVWNSETRPRAIQRILYQPGPAVLSSGSDGVSLNPPTASCPVGE